MAWLQQGRIATYLLYSFVTLLVLLAFVLMTSLHWLTQVLEVLAALLAAPLFAGLDQPVPGVAAEQVGAEPAAAVSRHPQAVSQGRRARHERLAAVPRGTLRRVRRDGAAPRRSFLRWARELPFSDAADAIALVGLFATARVFMSLAAMDVGTAFGTLGARREMLVGFLAEPALLMVIFLASLISATTALPAISEDIATRHAGALSEPRVHRPSHSCWCCSPRTRASRSTIRRRISSSR